MDDPYSDCLLICYLAIKSHSHATPHPLYSNPHADKPAWTQRGELQLVCWMLPLAIHCHTSIITSTHSTSCFSNWLLSNNKQVIILVAKQQINKDTHYSTEFGGLCHMTLFPICRVRAQWYPVVCQLDAALRHNTQPKRSSRAKNIQRGTYVIHNCVYYLSEV